MRFVLCQLLILITLFACSNDDSDSNRVTLPQQENVEFEILTDRTDVIWGFDFLPDQRIIFSERSGRILIFNADTRQATNISGVPEVSIGGEGGLMDLKLHPDFTSNNQVYFCHTVSGRSIALSRGQLSETLILNIERIFTSSDASNSSIHFGCRIEFDNSNRIFLTLGDQSLPSKAQDLNSHLGKILRINDDGTYPADNPFVTTPGALPEIWSRGHRNPQGLAIQPETGELYSAEHGPQGGDELNVIETGLNYGWPLVTTGQPQGDLGESAPGYVDPIANWSPAIAPSGISFWRGNLYIASLRGEHIRRIVLSGRTVTSQTVLFQDAGFRFRNVRQGPDGLLYFSTDDGKIGRIISNE